MTQAEFKELAENIMRASAMQKRTDSIMCGIHKELIKNKLTPLEATRIIAQIADTGNIKRVIERTQQLLNQKQIKEAGAV